MNPKKTGREPHNKKYSAEQIVKWQNQILAGNFTQEDLARTLSVKPQRASAILHSTGGREYDQLRQLQRLIRRRKAYGEIAEAMGLSMDEVVELRGVLYRRRLAGLNSSASGR